MFKRLKNNPILAQQVRDAGWPSVRTAVLIAVALTVIGLALTNIALIISPDDLAGGMLPMLIWLPEILLLIFGPLVVAIAAEIETMHAIDSEYHQMNHLGQLPERDIVQGYLACAVFRLRLLWMAAGGLLLPSIVSGAQVGLAVESVMACLPSGSSGCTFSITQELVMEVVRDSVILMLSCAALFVVYSWLAATLGVWMAFLHRQKSTGLAVTLLVVSLMIALSFVMRASPPGIFMLSVIAIVLGWAAYQQAVDCVRGMPE